MGIDIAYRTDRKAVLYVWRPKITTENGIELLAVELTQREVT